MYVNAKTRRRIRRRDVFYLRAHAFDLPHSIAQTT